MVLDLADLHGEDLYLKDDYLRELLQRKVFIPTLTCLPAACITALHKLPDFIRQAISLITAFEA